MMRIAWIFTFFGIIASGACSNLIPSHHLRWLFPDQPVAQVKPERSLCTTKQCANFAKLLTENMNKSVDPCEDFYEYACGNFEKYNPLPPDEKHWNLLVKSQRNVFKRLEEILKSKPEPEDLHAVRFSKQAYTACMNTDEMDKAGLQPLISTLWRAGGWPLIMEEEEWNEEIYKWQTIDDYYASITGANAFHDLHVDQFSQDAKDISLIILAPHLPRNMGELSSLVDIDMDISDENNDSGEGSQEEGSEERHEKDEYVEKFVGGEEYDEEEYEDEFYVQRRKRSKRNVNNKLANKQKINKQINSRRKRTMIKTENKRRKIMNHIVRKPTSHPDSIKKPKTEFNKRNNKEIEDTNSDLYFNDENGEYQSTMNDYGNNKKKKRDINSYEYPDDYDISEESGSGSGDHNDNEEDGEDGSGSGDEEDGSGSGDHNDNEEDGEDGSGSGDEEDGSGNGDQEDGSGSGDQEDGSGDDDQEDSSGNDDQEDGSGNDDQEDDKTDEDNSSEERKIEKEKKTMEARKKYVKYMLNVSMALAEARGVPVPKEKLEKDIADLLNFEINFLKIVYKYREKLDINLKLFQKKYDCLVPTTNNGKINWIKKVQNVFTNGGMDIDEETQVLIDSFSYIKNLQRLLDKTPSKTIVNYVHWNFLSKVLKTSTKEMRDWYYNWSNEEVTAEKRSSLCIKEIQAEYSLGYAYIKKYFSDEILQTASDMIDDIQMEVAYQIKQSAWMNDKTRHSILDKLVYMKRLIGYPDSYRNETVMKQHFKGLSASRSHYDNTLSIMRYLKWQRLKAMFTKKLAPDEIPLNPLIVNAFFMAIYNAIQITAADFQSPLFDFQPWYTNFGAIGVIMAHEVNHGFDSRGRLYDHNGEYLAWLPAMAMAYDKRAECFEDQFTKYSVADNRTGNVRIQNYGFRTRSENIADSMGLQAAFRAYQRRQRICQQPDPMLPGLEEFSNEQLLFLSFASMWCEVNSPEEFEKKIQKDVHSLAPLRLIGSVSNSEDFARSFKCPEGSRMNPKKKCNIWK